MRNRNFSRWSALVHLAVAICLIATAAIYFQPSLAAPVVAQADRQGQVALLGATDEACQFDLTGVPVEDFGSSERGMLRVELPDELTLGGEGNGLPTMAQTTTSQTGGILVFKQDDDLPCLCGGQISGWKMTLFSGSGCTGEPLAEGRTDEDGLVRFEVVVPGTYSVLEEVRDGVPNLTPICQTVTMESPALGVAPPIINSKSYPMAGEDTFQTGAAITVQLPEPIGNVILTPVGPMTVRRSDPGDRDNDGLVDIETEIISMTLTGKIENTGAEVKVTMDPGRPSKGMVEQQTPGKDFPANSYFDVFVRIDTPLETFVNDSPVRMETVISQIPPIDLYTRYAAGPNIPIFDENGFVVGYIQHTIHVPLPPDWRPVFFVNDVSDVSTCPPPPSTLGAGFLFGPSAPIDTVTASIPPEGGSLQSLDGRVTISFPPGSVSTPVKIAYAPQPGAQVSSHFSVLEAFAVNAYEGGSWQKTTDFDQPVEVRVTYTEADARFANEEELSLYYFNTALNEWIPIQSEVNTIENALVAKLKNFGLVASLYAVMAPISPTISASSMIGHLIIVAATVLALLVVLAGWLVYRRGRQRKTTSNA